MDKKSKQCVAIMQRFDQGLRTAVLWSGGKDSAYALYLAQQAGVYEIYCLLTTFSQAYGRVSMHGVAEHMIEKQAKALELPLYKVMLGDLSTNEAYATTLQAELRRLKHELQITHCLAGDIYLEDVRAYREQLLTEVGLSAVFPLWAMPTKDLARDILRVGIGSRLCCVQQDLKHHLGTVYDEALLAALPKEVDPCGENGEFHSYCYAGPMYRAPIEHLLGKRIYRRYTSEKSTKGFWFIDILPGVG